jgi:hypothetical protein
MVPAGAPVGETPSPTRSLLPLCCWAAGTLEELRPEHVPHPECGSRTSSDKSLILVITRVEAGDRACLRWWRPRWPCWPTVGGHRRGCVDTWTTRRLCTDGGRSPLALPWLPPVHPQASPWTGRGLRGIAATERVGVARDAGSGPHRPRSAPCAGSVYRRCVRSRGGAARSGAVTPRHPPGTRSPQAVHIPGDNFSTCRSRSPSEIAPLRGTAATHPCVAMSTRLWRRQPDRAAGEPAGQPPG